MDDERVQNGRRRLRREAVIADALSTSFQADTTRLADISGLVIRHAPLGPVTAVYLPPPEWGDRAVLALDDGVAPDIAEYMTAVGLGHLLLAHERYHAYMYGAAGALYRNVAEETAADLFARHFLRTDLHLNIALDA